MNNDQVWQFISSLGTFFLQSLAIFLATLLVSGFLEVPRRRFQLHLGFILLISGAWVLFLVGAFSSFTSALASTAHQLGVPSHSLLTVPIKTDPFSHSLFLWTTRSYFSIVAILLMIDVKKHWHLRFLLRRGLPAPDAIQAAVDRVCGELGLPRYDLILMRRLSSPGVVGIFRRRIALPEVCAEWEPEALEDVLRHELIHIRRNDYLWAQVANVASRFLFFHPGVWYCRQQMQVNRELACDQEVIMLHPERNANYAGLLTRFARLQMLGDSAAPVVDFARSTSLLARRVHALLEEKPVRSRFLGTASAIMVLTLAAFSLPFLQFALRPPMQSAQETAPHTIYPKRRQTRGRSYPTTVGREVSAVASEPSTTPEISSPPLLIPSVTSSNASLEATETARPTTNTETQVWSETLPGTKASATPSIRQMVISGVAGLGRVIHGDHDARGRPDPD